MKIISDLSNYSPSWDKCVLTLGNFDGIHKGHQKIIQKTVSIGIKKKIPSVFLTYEPSPRKVLQRLKFDSKIYTKEEKISLLQEYSLQIAIFLPFDKKMAKVTAKKFLKEILLEKLKAKIIVIGHDHKFGRNRHGHYSYLQLASQRYDIEVEKIKPVRIFRKVASSTWIRSLIQEGNIKKANKLLGMPYMIQASVILGKQRGKQIGIPTANLYISEEKLVPKEGVYTCIAKYGNVLLRAVTNIGYNPTFKDFSLSIETHILDFDLDIYGEKLTLYFIDRLRDEEKFDDIENLRAQIIKDIEKAKDLKLSIPES